MKVRELIAQLEVVEDKELDVVIEDEYGVSTDLEVFDLVQRYYGKADGYGWTACSRVCVLIDH